MLTCEACGTDYALTTDAPYRCDCGHALEYADSLVPAADAPPDTLDRDRGLWAVPDCLPVSRAVTLGEGWTPLVDAPAWDAQYKLEYVFPTGSFKDRGAAITLSQAAALGVDCVLEDSSRSRRARPSGRSTACTPLGSTPSRRVRSHPRRSKSVATGAFSTPTPTWSSR